MRIFAFVCIEFRKMPCFMQKVLTYTLWGAILLPREADWAYRICEERGTRTMNCSSRFGMMMCMCSLLRQPVPAFSCANLNA
ncbi:hypothetical protein SUBVAR_05956 [Subdoligranulum variabile DSM 15176]|uniref:Uncharacterized protein n=1 Tax=Subdoligranulum variabile DSM 15176 TaxID=411471 RepID=D1PNN5_9FIRM|nr:hypothetical protein SUBVAR_05956 [Subdoligranulum variabile DSM 15176]